MKKSLATLLLALAMVVPAFATDKGAMEADVKLGYIIEPYSRDGDDNTYIQKPAFSVGADFYYYVINNLAAGLGVNYVFDSNFDDGWDEDMKLGATNIYLSVKPVLKVEENKIIDKVYLLGQLGLGITRYSDNSYDFSENGFYWGIGAGVEKCNVIVEFLYSVNYWSHNESGWSESWSYSNRRLAINLGYRFSL